jgi:putrescine aminotransferase
VLDGMAGLWNVNIGYGSEELPAGRLRADEEGGLHLQLCGHDQRRPRPSWRTAWPGWRTRRSTPPSSRRAAPNPTTPPSRRRATTGIGWGKTEKFKFIARQAAYHGITVAATAATGIPRYHTMFGPLMAGFSHIPAPNPYRYTGDIAW